MPLSPLGLRNRALTGVIYSGALRVGEALTLTPSDLLWGEGKIYVCAGKSSSASRYVEFLPIVQKSVRSYLAVRERFLTRPTALLFLSIRGQALTGQDVNRFLLRAGEAAGIPIRLHTHLLRHSMATQLYQGQTGGEKVDLKVLKEYLGHSSLQSTDVYTHMGDRQVSTQVRQAYPWARPIIYQEVDKLVQEAHHAQP